MVLCKLVQVMHSILHEPTTFLYYRRISAGKNLYFLHCLKVKTLQMCFIILSFIFKFPITIKIFDVANYHFNNYASFKILKRCHRLVYRTALYKNSKCRWNINIIINLETYQLNITLKYTYLQVIESTLVAIF